jgi:PAS domain S-box-containing protein
MNDRSFVSNILIVDDEPSNLLALEAILEPLGQNLIRAASGVEALKHALKNELSVVLMDVQMPEMDGFEAAELLRKRPKTRDVPIIFLTAISKDRKFISRGYDVGAVDYLFKPYEPDILRSKVSVFVELAKKNAIIREQAEELRRMSERELADFKKRSEQRYENLADSMPQIVWTADALGSVQYVNRRWNDFAKGARDFAALVHPDDLAAFVEGWRSAVARGKQWEAELRFGNAERGYCFHLVRAVPRVEDGRIEGWIGTSTEIDARVRAERALRLLADASRRLGASLDEPSELEATLRSSLPLLGDAAVLDLRDGTKDGATSRRVVTAHPVDAAVVEDPRFDLGPSTVAYSHRPEVYLDIEAEMETTHSGRGAENLRFLSELRVSGYMCLPLASRGRSIGTLTFVKLAGGRYEQADVSVAEDLASRIAVAIENVRLHETTEKRREELEQANKSKDVFLATLSHELRTPLNAIVGWTDMMKNGALQGDELKRAFDTIDRNAHALNGLVADLLDVSRIVTDTLKLDSKLVSIGAIVEAAIEAARPQASVKQVHLDVSIERGGGVRGDAGRLRQIVANLLSNAIKFTPAGGTITVRIDRDGERARVLVKDSGEGIAPDFLPHVFERFRQAENARAKGLGLGLAIVKHLVEAHGGTVHAESEGRGKGATFVVTLPVESEEALAAEEEGRVSHPPSGQPELRNLHILVVEDDPDGNELITTILERYGARVTSVGTAAAALDALDAETPNVLVSDIGLPDKDGIELIKTVRAKDGFAQLPAIALTAYASRQDAAKALAAGFDAHVAKPVQPGTLGTAVARLIARDAKSSTAA